MNGNFKIRHLLLSIMAVFVLNETAYCENFEVDKIIAAIKNEIEIARSQEAGIPRMKIDRVDVELSVVASKSADGGVKFNVAGLGANLGASVAKSDTQRIKLALVPFDTIDIANDESLGLAPAIREVKKAIKSAYNTEPRLSLESFTFDVEFSFIKKAEGGFSFYIVDVGSLKTSKLATHIVSFKMSIAE